MIRGLRFCRRVGIGVAGMEDKVLGLGNSLRVLGVLLVSALFLRL